MACKTMMILCHDVLLWAREGWIDYNIPQVYWEIGHKAADYEILVKWWATHSENWPLFIGQSVPKTVQFADPQNPSIITASRKMALQRAYQTIGGSCQYVAVNRIENQGRYRDALISEYHKYRLWSQSLILWMIKLRTRCVK